MRTSDINIADDIHVLNKRKKDIDSVYEESDSKKYKMSNGESGASSTDDNTNYMSYNKKVPNNLEEWLTMFYNWSHGERITALDSLVTSEICEVQELRHLLSLIEPQLQRDFISLLPKELSLYVLSFLDPPDLLRAAQTCRYWHILCEDNLLWREKCRDEGLLEDNETISDFFRKRISSTNSNSCSNYSTIESTSSPLLPINQATPNQQNFQRSEYKLSYLRHKSIEFNWRHGILNYNTNEDGQISAINENQIDNDELSDSSNQFPTNQPNDLKSNNSPTLEKKTKIRRLKETLHLKGHEDHVITCLQFNPTSNIIVSGSDDNTLKVWSSVTGRCLRTLIGHTGGVWSSQLSPENVVISGSTDRTLRVWNALNGVCKYTLYGHTSTVRCMALHGKHVVSGSRDATLRVWNIETGLCDHVLVGHVAAVRCVQFNGSHCVSGAYDYLVKVWDVASETCLHTLEGHTNRVYSLQFDGKHIVSGSLDTSIRVWSSETGKLNHTLIGHQSLTSGMQLRSNILVSGNADSTVKVWDINTGQCLQTLSGVNKHQSAVTCLQFNSKFVITSSDDGTVKLWDLKTGKFIRNLVSLPSGGSGGVVWRIRASNTKLVCAVGSRNGTEETKLLVLDFETPNTNYDLDSKSSSLEYFNRNTQSQLNVFSDNLQHSKSTSSACLNQFFSCHSQSPTFTNFPQPENQEFPSTETKSKILTLVPSSSLSASTSSSALSSLSSTPSSSHMILPSISLASLQSISSTSSDLKSCTMKMNCETQSDEFDSAMQLNQSEIIVDNILNQVNDIISQPTSVENNCDDDEVMEEDDC